MVDENTQAKLDRLARIEEQNRARAKRYLERVKTSGRKQLSAIISSQCHDQLSRIRDKGQVTGKPTSFGKIIENAVDHYTNKHTPTNDTTGVNINADPMPVEITPTDDSTTGIQGAAPDFLLVDVKAISPTRSLAESEETIDKLADSIIECGGLVMPLILKQTGVERYTVISGHLGYYAARRAREKEPRRCEMVNAMVIKPNDEGGITKQLNMLKPKGNIKHDQPKTIDTPISEPIEQNNISVNINDNVKQKQTDNPAPISVNINGSTNQGEPSPHPTDPMPDPMDIDAHREWLFNWIDRLRIAGWTWGNISEKFNAEGIKMLRGKTWTPDAIRLLHRRMQKLKAEKKNN